MLGWGKKWNEGRDGEVNKGSGKEKEREREKLKAWKIRWGEGNAMRGIGGGREWEVGNEEKWDGKNERS